MISTAVGIAALLMTATPPSAAAKFFSQEAFCESGLAWCFRPDSRIFFGIRPIADARTWTLLSSEIDIGAAIGSGITVPVTAVEIGVFESWVGLTIGYVAPLRLKLRANSSWLTTSPDQSISSLAGLSIGPSFGGGAIQVGAVVLFIDERTLYDTKASVPFAAAYISLNILTIIRQAVAANKETP